MNGYDWSRLVAKVNLADPVTQKFADGEEAFTIASYRCVAFLQRLEQNDEAANGYN
jgi:hypothetical protein